MLSIMKTVRVPIALVQSIMRTLREKLQQANIYLNTNYPEPTLLYNQRGTIAGSAYYANWEIRINPTLLIENKQNFIDEVIPHELAHLLVNKHFGRVAPHGKEWKWMMETVLQVSAKRTHHFDISNVCAKTFSYACLCEEIHQLTIRRHNKIQRGETQYRCRHCQAILQLIKP
ncbi:SprT family protein [Proteus myxofaciens ATCC 19692]|uniref:Protein SprT n=2 Tax=Proteus myxofaciens TaxID=184072 RepID=A0A198GCI3_9GAMM|nr:SprT family protein [Proteus myxofaciens ATCC 19692]